MQSWLEGPLVPVVSACFVTGLAWSVLARLPRRMPASLGAPLVFLVAYYLTYGKIPAFPPLGATSKIFYVVIVAGLAGFLLDLWDAGSPSWVGSAKDGPREQSTGSSKSWIPALFASLLIAIWIGWPRLAEWDLSLAATLAALIVAGALILWRLANVDRAPFPPLAGAVLLAVLPAVFAPIALFGGSSTSVGLCLGLTAGLGTMALVNLLAPRALELTAVLGVGGGLLAVIDTITLITRHIDFPALVLFLSVPFIGRAGAAAVLPGHLEGTRSFAVVAGLIAALPVVAIVAVLLLRHESPL